MMRRWLFILLGGTALLAGTLPASAQQFQPCDGVVFSTEEDFLTQAGTPPDGNPIISDGDLLSFNPATGGTHLCARNSDLLRSFELRVDLGLDAVDVAEPERPLIAFSTELDDPEGRFTAGDMLATNGAVLPNSTLMFMAFQKFNLPMRQDFGLDGLQFIGRPEAILELLENIAGRPRDFWEANPEAFLELLSGLDVDIWFSTEGTGFSPENPAFLDGDLLSARTGNIVVPNSLVLPLSVPAGLPVPPGRGADFGLDAVVTDRQGNIEALHFSTEIFFDGAPSFTDGDVLRFGNGIALNCEDLVRPLEPLTGCLGVDALHFPFAEPPQDPHIQTLCGRSIGEVNGGSVNVGGAGTGLIEEPLVPPALVSTLTRPCGASVPIDGYLPSPPGDVTRFRVVYREVGESVPGMAGDPATPAVQTAWRLLMWDPISSTCKLTSTPVLATDPQGWMDATQYLEAKTGADLGGAPGSFTGGCVNPELRLAVWNTAALPAGTPVGDPIAGHDREDHYVVWLEWEDASGMHREPVDHHVQLDNTLPVIAPFPAGLQVRLMDGTTPVPACGEAPEGSSQFQVWGQFQDRHYWRFTLAVRGGLPPASQSYGPHHFYDPDDGTPPVKNTNATGTTPTATTVHLRNIDMTDLGASFTDCCYLLDLYVWDTTIRHSFNGHVVNDVTGAAASNAFITFAASP